MDFGLGSLVFDLGGNAEPLDFIRFGDGPLEALCGMRQRLYALKAFHRRVRGERFGER
jgi:hypothetical protein